MTLDTGDVATIVGPICGLLAFVWKQIARTRDKQHKENRASLSKIFDQQNRFNGRLIRVETKLGITDVE